MITTELNARLGRSLVVCPVCNSLKMVEFHIVVTMFTAKITCKKCKVSITGADDTIDGAVEDLKVKMSYYKTNKETDNGIGYQ